jgi:high-affinity iron transporter
MGIFLWPARLTPSARAKTRLLIGTAAALGVVAVALAVAIPPVDEGAPASMRRVADRDGHVTAVTLLTSNGAHALAVGPSMVPLGAAGTQTIDGANVDVWQAKTPADPELATTAITLGQLADLTGGRLPVGLSAARTPGPFGVQWNATTVYTVRTHHDGVVGADAKSSRTATLTGGGLSAPKTVSVGGLRSDWATSEADDQAVTARIAQSMHDQAEQELWTLWAPTVLVIGAAGLLLAAARGRRTTTKNEREQQNNGEESERGEPDREDLRVS